MSFVNTQFLYYAVAAIVLIVIVLNRLNGSYFKWVKSYWFFERTWASRISSLVYIVSLFLFLMALLDLRGPEKKIRASLPDQRTILLLDTSASMLAEDVRPSRFVKSLQIARHFVKNAPGHQVSIVLFSDIQKRLIPFTDDIDLVDSRLAALEKTNSVSGGSNISQAIEEAVQYFETDTDDENSNTGNLIVFTDAEESEGEFKVKIPTSINLAIVGVGTAKGANIPLRWEDGSFRGYKNFKGEPVTTKLDENYIKKMGRNVQNFRYWIANSYSLPTEEIMNFFRSTYNKKQSTGDMRIRPVYSHYILIPAIILFCLSVIIGRFPVFKMPKNIIVFFLMSLSFAGLPLVAQEKNSEEEKSTPEIKKDLERIQEGKADREYILKTAEKMLRAKDEKRATELYNEYSKKDDSEAVKFNHATALLKSSRFKESLPIIQDLLKNSKNEDLKNKLRQNLSLFLDQKKKQEQKQKEEEKEKDKKENQDNKENKDEQKSEDSKKPDDKKGNDSKNDGKNEGKQGQQKPDQQEQKSKDGQQKPDKDSKQGQDQKDKNDEKNKGDKKANEKDDEGKEQEDEKQSGPSTLDEKEKEIEKKRRMVKTPAMVKQIMSDDRELQKKMMDTSTNVRGEQKPKRDW